jgi:hypothetical protein
MLWDKSIGGNNEDWLWSLVQTSDGGYLLGGESTSGISGDKTQISNGGNDYWVVKLDSNGNKLWDKTIGGLDDDYLYVLVQTPDGGYILGGSSHSDIYGDKTQPSKGGSDYWIVKLGPDATTGINESTSNFNLTISPNPSQGKIQLLLNNLTAKTAEVTVSDLLSRTVFQQQLPGTDKQLSQEINLPKVKGMYLLQVKAGAAISTRKIVVE